MDAPKCKLCGQRHWGACKPFDKIASGLTEVMAIITREAAPPPPKPRAPRGTFDRTAYQREYMRKRRTERKSTAS